MNQCNFIGKVSSDVEQKTLDSGANLSKFALDVPKSSNSQYYSRIYCTGWRKIADTIDEKIRKGMVVAVSGRLESREHDSKTYWELTLTNVERLGGGGQSAPKERATAEQRQESTPPQEKTDMFGEAPDDDDDFPFG